MSYNTSTAHINLTAIANNVKQLKSLAPNSNIMAVLKANAYGHGLIEVARCIQHDVDGIAVARLHEAVELRENSVTCPLLLLGTSLDNDVLDYCAGNDMAVVTHTMDDVKRVAQSSLSNPIKVWLKVDTGMHRLGIDAAQAEEAFNILTASSQVNKIIGMTHFSDSEKADKDNTSVQTASFDTLFEPLPCEQSLANSAGILFHPNSHRDWIRPGIMLFGINPSSEMESPISLQPAMTLSSKILSLRHIQTGETVGYNGIWTAQRPSIIATLGIGYGDGYPRHAANGTPVLINGERARLAGRVSMDLMTVDVTDCSNVNVGDEAILWGEGLSANEVADHCSTISYELFTSVSSRVTRRYS